MLVGRPTPSGVAATILGDGDGWPATLVTRSGEPPKPGEELDARIMDPSEPSVTTDIFGFMSISDQMRPRYEKAVYAGLALVGDRDPGWLSAQTLSELKGMFNRVLRRDQRDWATVAVTLGDPDSTTLRRWVSQLTDVRRSVAAGHKEVSTALQDDPLFAETLRRAGRFLSGRSILDPVPIPGVSPKRSRTDRSRKLTARAPNEMILRAQEAQAKLERANRAHQVALFALDDELRKRGFKPTSDKLLDLFCELPSGPAIYEVKSLSETNWLSQVRKGIAQLKEYRFRYGLTDKAALYLVCSSPIPDNWVLDLLIAEYGIGCCWQAEDGFAGPGARAALGGAPA